MTSPVFQNGNRKDGAKSIFDNVPENIRENPVGYGTQMYNTNPSFKAFADSMRGKSPKQMIREVLGGGGL